MVILVGYVFVGDAEEIYYAIEIDGVACGYARLQTSTFRDNGVEKTLLEHEQVVKASLLGARVDSHTEITYHLDPVTGRYSYFHSDTTQGSSRFTSEVHVEGEKAWFTSSFIDGVKTIPLDDDVVLEDSLSLPHLKADLVERGLAESGEAGKSPARRATSGSLGCKPQVRLRGGEILTGSSTNPQAAAGALP